MSVSAHRNSLATHARKDDMKRLILACAFTIAAGGASAALAQTNSTTLSARKSRPSSGQIACTVFGCHPIPRGCYIRTEYDIWGNPTGFDRVTCPRR
jgi:hypothetical protein